MPTTKQTGTKSAGEFESEPKKMLATKNDLTIAALIRGIRDPDRAQAYIEAEIDLAGEEDRDPRKSVIGACNRKKAVLTPDEDEEEDGG